MKCHSLDGLVAQLRDLNPAAIDAGAITELLAAAELADSSLSRYLSYAPDRYVRSLVHRCLEFDVLLLCWEGGQQTPIHNHSGQCGWVRVLRGAMVEERFAPASPEPPPWQMETPVRLLATGRTEVAAGPTVATVDRERAIHRLVNPSRERALTLHVYRRPHDSCLTYDANDGLRRRKDLVFDLVDGNPVALRASDVRPGGQPEA